MQYAYRKSVRQHIKKNNKEQAMSIEKKSLISNRSASKKAIVTKPIAKPNSTEALGVTHQKSLGVTHQKSLGVTHQKSLGITHQKSLGITHQKSLGITHVKVSD